MGKSATKNGNVPGGRKLAIEHVAPLALNPAAYNPRTMSDEARGRLERSVKEFGLVDPIVARRQDGLVIGGHQRLEAAKKLGLETVPVVYLDDIDDNRAAALNVQLNNPGSQGEWDMPKLTDLLSELDANGFDATLTGFDGDELEKMLTFASGNPADHEGAGLDGLEYQVVVSCAGEHQQAAICQELESRGFKCRILTL